MRPLSIALQAFGSYPGPVAVDFTVLAGRGLFLVTGDTGSGKTTIFDAMCFALYGAMPHKDEKEIRSHHAAPEVSTFVEFTFECDGVRYVARRSPEQERPAKRGSGTVTEKATASLVRCTDGGGTTSLATKAGDVRAAATEILGLEAEQFQRVILLPQGEIARFLLAGSKEREGLLGKLFGAAVFDAILDTAKQREHDLAKAVGDVDTRIDHELKNARAAIDELHVALGLDPVAVAGELDRTALDPQLAAAEPEWTAIEHRSRAVLAQAQEAASRLEQARAAADRHQRATKLRSELAELEAAAVAVATDEDSARQSAAARPVVVAAEKAAAAEQSHNEAARCRDDRLARIHSALAAVIDVPVLASERAIHTAVDGLKSELDRMTKLLSDHEAAVRAIADIARELTHLDAARTERSTRRQQLLARRQEIAAERPAIRARAVDLDSLDDQIRFAAKQVEARIALDAALGKLAIASRVEAETIRAFDEVFRRFVATAAPRLAADLPPDAPCPVCGSTQHPCKATADDGAPTSFAEVDAIAEERNAATAERQRADAEVALLRGGLGGDAEVPVDDLRHRETGLRTRRRDAQEAHRRSQELEVEDARLAEDERELAERLAELGGTIAAKESRRKDLEAAAERTRAAAAAVDPAAVTRLQTAFDEVKPLCDGLDRIFSAAARAHGAAIEAAGNLRSAVDASPFDSVAAARSVLLPPSDEEARLRAAIDHRDRTKATTAALETLVAQGVPTQAPDIDAAEKDAAAAHSLAAQLQDRFATARNARAAALRALVEYDRLETESGEMRTAFARTKRAARVLAHGGGLNMPLRRWVLANELDRVSAAANVHLQRLTASRYTLRRRQEVIDGRRAFGLDLEVVDAHTGRARSASSLSGGEQFQASLALALGLADVVSRGGNASGRRFEALFVDEGFGSLDPTALQEAIGALHQLHAMGRMVGAITHVEAMKQDLHVGIEVRRLPDGRGSTLRVNP